MTYRYIVFILTCFLGTSLSAQVTPPLKNGLHPKSETEWTYPIVDFMPADVGIKKADREYAADGKQSRCRYHSPNSPVVQEYFFQDEPATRQRKYYWQKNEGQRILEYSEHYNASGKLQRRFRFRSDGKLIDSLVCKYDAQNRLLTEVSYNSRGQVVYQTQYEYDDERLVCTEIHEDILASKKFQIGVQFNEQGQVTLRKRYATDGTLVDKTEFIRDEKGQLIEKRYYRDGKTLETRETYQYDTDKNRAVWSVYNQGGAQLVEYTVFEYTY